ncbi:MAG: hypothetical protein AMJ61_11000 [Desulfobacterales bacterium SG8_35_2]|nr:MAG: hypothetical protein AMJ61_11000 [Desulfobacterales bacterium SG8_35_2]
MNFQAYLGDTYRIIKEEPLILILGGLVVQLLTLLSMGILAGPFLGGYFLLIIYFLRDNKKPTFNDIFLGLQQWLYVLPLMVDRKISFSEAMRVSMNKVNETGFLMHFVFLLLISVIPMMLLNFLSAMIPFLIVLKILLPPFQAGCLASLYIDKFGLPEPDNLSQKDEETADATAEASGPGVAGEAEQTASVAEDQPAATEAADESGSDEKTKNHSPESENGQEQK